MRMTEEQYSALLQRRQTNTVTTMTKRPKYGNRKVTDPIGAVYDSTKEFRRWQELQLRERAGEIAELRRQVPFALVVEGELICKYIADFVYFDGKAAVVEDVKSPATRKLEGYRLKVKLMSAILKLQVREV